jgi:hypothetical protein
MGAINRPEMALSKSTRRFCMISESATSWAAYRQESVQYCVYGWGIATPRSLSIQIF